MEQALQIGERIAMKEAPSREEMNAMFAVLTPQSSDEGIRRYAESVAGILGTKDLARDDSIRERARAFIDRLESDWPEYGCLVEASAEGIAIPAVPVELRAKVESTLVDFLVSRMGGDFDDIAARAMRIGLMLFVAANLRNK